MNMREIELHSEELRDVEAVYCGYNRMTQANFRHDRSAVETSDVIEADNLMLVALKDTVRLYAFPLSRHGLPWIRLEDDGRTLRAGMHYDGEGNPDEGFLRGDFPSAASALRAAVSPSAVRTGRHGWCSWYHHFTGITEANLRENLAACATKDEIDVFQVDMGFCPHLGDWLTPGDGFTRPITELVSDIAAAGMVPGVWLAPFAAESDSKLYSNHEDWFYADDVYRWKSEAKPWKCLDLSVPQALDWIVSVVSRLHEAGARYFKLDFIDMALVTGTRRDMTQSGVELYRHALASIGAAAPDSYVLGCNPVMSASVDVMDALRVGEDTAPRWSPKAGAFASAHRALRTGLGRTYLREAVEVDLDCMLLRGAESDLSPLEIETYENAVAASGEQRFLSDDMSRVDDAVLADAFRPMPHENRVLVPTRPLSENEPSSFDVFSGAQWVGKLLCNWGDGELCIVPLLAFGAEASTFRDFRSGESLGSTEICLKPRQSLLAVRTDS